jgi:hypothetical protein
MNSNSKKNKAIAKGSDKMRDYSKESFFIKKADASKETLRKYPLPKELTTPRK